MKEPWGDPRALDTPTPTTLMTSNPTIGPGALPNRKAGRLLFFYLRLNLLLLLHGRLRLRALQEHLLIVELSYFGIPVSTTHTITGAIVGVGAARKTAAVRWNVASDVILAWIVTLPAAALFGAAFYQLYKLLS